MGKKTAAAFDPRYVSLDHWRGVAALAVVLFHGFGSARIVHLVVHPSIAWLKALSDYGWLGVDLFFVISGYCIAANLYRMACSNLGSWGFFRDRLFRIYPTYWVACILAIALNTVAAPFNHVSLADNLPANWTAALGDVLLVEPYLHTAPFLLVSWTLVYELGFYLLAAFGYALWRRGINLYGLFVVAIGLAVWGLWGVPWLGGYVLQLWPEFLCGGVVFFCLWLKNLRPSIALWPLVILLGFAILGNILPLPGQRCLEMTLAAAFACLLVLLHPYDGQIARWRSLHWLAWVGTISYSLYLTHTLFMGKVINLVSRRIAADSLFQLPLQLIGWLAAILGAWLIFKFCEQPLECWRHSMRRRSTSVLRHK